MRLITTTRISAKRDVLESVGIGLVLTALSYAVALGAHWISSLNWLEVLSVITAYSGTYLCVKERRANYTIGAVSTAAYSLLFLQSGLFSSALLNAYLTPALLYGWFRWRKDSNTRPITHVSPKMIPVYLLVAVLGYAGAALLSQSLGGSMAWTDAIILAGSVLAQFLLDNKKIETWLVWALVDLFAIYTYATTGLSLVAFQYIFFTANTVYGFIIWRRSKRTTEVLTPGPVTFEEEV